VCQKGVGEMEKGLKPCPFCGDVNDLEYESWNAWYFSEGLDEDISVRCANCGAFGPPCNTTNEAREAWNERKAQ